MTSSGADWSDSTIIKSSELDNFFYESMDDEDENVIIHGYSIKVLESGFNYSGLEEYLGDKFADYVFPSKKKQELLDKGKSPAVRAQQKAGFNKDYQRDGNLGEFLLFLLVDGYFDIPMISHKIIYKQNYQHEVYGSDNLFFGEFKDREHIGVGEAKIYGGITDGVRAAVESIGDFHNENSRRYMEQELSLAPKNISRNLNEQQIDYLADVMVDGGYSDFPIFHPVFICYGQEDLKDVEDVTKSIDEIEDEISEILKDEDYISKIDNQVEQGHHRINRAHLLFLILPVADLDEFRKRMLTSIVPGIGPAISPEDDSDDSKTEVES
ncbi:DUF1837 domain-containing protein [Haladaptatus sp. DJG-WS-42]|uniref:HamA C-terminal domain-containing protein n=1 Tax=Haladaptatus sp. DJG-WS-42 TaxID=3120516 RepID=UPI0030D35B05